MDLNDLKTWHYVAAIGGAALLLGFVLYFLPTGKLKVPGVLTAMLGGIATGLALGVIWLAGFGYKPNAPPDKAPPELPPGMGKDAGPGPKFGGRWRRQGQGRWEPQGRRWWSAGPAPATRQPGQRSGQPGRQARCLDPDGRREEGHC